MGKKSKKKVQWRRLSLNELQSNDTTSKRRQRKTPERDVKDGDRSAWSARQPAQADHPTGTNKRGPLSAEELPDTRFQRPQQDDDFSNYNNHSYNASQRFGNNFYDRRFHNNGPHPNTNINTGNDYHHHVMNGGSFQNGIQQHERYEASNYHCGYSNRGGMMDRPYRNFDRDRTRFYNNYPGAPFERYGRDVGCNGPNGPMVSNGLNGFYHDRRRPMYRMNGRPNNGYPLNYGGGGESPPKHRRWSNGDEPSCSFPPRNPSSYHNGNSSNLRYHDGSHCGNGHDSGGSNGYEGGSSETQSEPEERQPVHQPEQSILIDNDQYTKIQTPRQEVIFKKNSGGSGCPPFPTPPSRSQSLTADRPPHHKGDTSKRAGSTAALSRNKKNRPEVSSASKLETNKSTSSNCSNKKTNCNRRGDATQPKKGGNQADLTRARTGKENYSKPGDGGKAGNKKQSARADSSAAPLKQDTDGTQSDNLPVKEEDEDYCAESDEDEDEEELYHQEEYSYQQDYPYLQDMQDHHEGFPASNPDAPPLAGVIMQQCYPGGPMVSIPVHWTSFLDPSLIPGDTALTPLDPAFTHLLDPSFKPLDPAKWDNLDPEAGPSNVIIPDNVIPVQHDASGCPVTVQVNVDENGVPINIEPSAFTVQLSSLGQHHHHHPSCQMAGLDPGMPFHYAQYADGNRRNQYFEYNFDEGLEKRLEQKIDEELAKHYSDEEDENTEKGDVTKTQQEERRDSRDCEEISYDSQYASMSEGSSLPTSPAGELSDSPSICPPNTPSEADVGGRSTPSIMKSAATPVHDTSSKTFTSTLPATTGSSISMSSASTLCSSSSSSSSTLVSLSSSPVNSGNPSKETSPSSPRQASRAEEGFSTSPFHTDQQETDLSSDDAQRPYDQNNKAQEENFYKPVTTLPAVSNDCPAVRNTAGSICNAVEANKVVLHLSDGIEDKCASKEKTADCVTDKSVIEATDTKTVVHKVKESISTTSLVEHSLERDVDHRGNEDNDNPPSKTLLFENLRENALSTYETATCAALNTVSTKNVSDASLAAVSEDHEADFGQLLVLEDSAASEEVGPQSSPEGASDDAPPPLLDGQGVTVTVKPGYVMVPILTPYYDPSVFYGYQMMPNEEHVDHSHYHGPHTSKKKKKKHNRRRGMEGNSQSYLDSDMYAGEPYVTTPDGYLMPMDASMCQYPMPGSLPYLHPMQQYQYEMLQQQIISQQYQQSSDEGFGSVEHSPFLPDTAESPVELTPDANQLTGGESKFGKLHETERQQIKEVLDDKTPTIGEVGGADLSDSGVSETEEMPRSTKTCRLESFISDPGSCDADEPKVDQCDIPMNIPRPQSNNLDSFATDKHEDNELKSELCGKISSHLLTQNSNQPYGDDETNTVVLAEKMSSSRSNTSSVAVTESPHNTIYSSDKDEVNSIIEVKNDSYNSVAQEIKSDESVCGSPNTVENIDGTLIPKSSQNIYCSLYVSGAIAENDKAILNCSSISAQSELMQVSSTKAESECCDEHLIDDECNFQNETAPFIQESLNTTFDCKEISNTDHSKNNYSSSLVKEEFLPMDDQDKSDLSSDVSLNDGVTDAMVAELEQEMTLAQSLIDSRISSNRTKRIALVEPSSPRNEFLALKDLKVTEAVRRWIREVTPEKAFTLHAEEAKSTLMDSRLSEASEDDEYFEDEVVEPGGGAQVKFGNQNTFVEAMAKADTNTDELSKNARGNPFGVLCSDSNCSVNITKRVATCSTSSDALDDYDGSSSVSSLSPEPLFSPPSSQIISKFSSQTITPNHSLECDHEEVDLRACTCNPSGYKKYYQLAAEVDESPFCTPPPMSPDETDSSAASRDQLLTTEILKAEECAIDNPSHLESCIFPPYCNCPLSRPPIKPSSQDKALVSSTSNCSSGLGSSLASTPALSPQHPPLHHPLSSPRLSFMLLPPNMRAESGSASLNTVHCCSLM